jgi:hypothetical protein
MAEVHQSLQQLGMRACPVCGSAESLGMSPFPVLLVDGKFPPDAGDFPVGEDRQGRPDLCHPGRLRHVRLSHAVRFARYRTGDEKIMVLGLAWERESQREE